jgi:Cft2 family RNA processing exonuclease
VHGKAFPDDSNLDSLHTAPQLTRSEASQYATSPFVAIGRILTQLSICLSSTDIAPMDRLSSPSVAHEPVRCLRMTTDTGCIW